LIEHKKLVPVVIGPHNKRISARGHNRSFDSILIVFALLAKAKRRAHDEQSQHYCVLQSTKSSH
jgi:hypothetical protein